MGNVSIPRPPDVVTVLWQRNPLQQRSPRTIVQATVIGNVKPCGRSKKWTAFCLCRRMSIRKWL